MVCSGSSSSTVSALARVNLLAALPGKCEGQDFGLWRSCIHNPPSIFASWEDSSEQGRSQMHHKQDNVEFSLAE